MVVYPQYTLLYCPTALEPYNTLMGHLYIRLLTLLMMMVFLSSPIVAQSINDTNIIKPDISLADISAKKTAIEPNTALDDDTKTIAIDALNTAQTALEGAQKNIESAQRYIDSVETVTQRLSVLNQELDVLRQTPLPGSDDDGGTIMTDETLLKIQQELFAKEGQLNNLRTEIDRYNAELQSAVTRPVDINAALQDDRETLAVLTEQITQSAETNLDPAQDAARTSLLTQKYFHETHIFALEKERAGLSSRQQILTLRRDIAELKSRRLTANVETLQAKTGLRRMLEAQTLEASSQNTRDILETAHPLVQNYATENLTLTQQLVGIASTTTKYPRLEATTRRQQAAIEDGQNIAQQLIDLGNLNRESSATLRRLREKTPSVLAIKAALSTTRQTINSAIQNRLLRQDQLRNLPIDSIDIVTAFEDWKAENPDTATLTELDIAALQQLYETRRMLLSRLSEAAQDQVDKATKLQALQFDVFTQTQTLTDTLNENLLWLPSIDAISMQWPLSVIKGFQKTLNQINLNAALTSFQTGLSQNIFITLFLVLIVGVTSALRPRILHFIQGQAAHVGRVQKDSYWITPSVVLACIIRALPIPLIFLTIASILGFSGSPNPFVRGLTAVCLYLSFYMLFFLTLREWDRDQSLFDKHLKLPEGFRRALNRELIWFVPLTGLSIAIILLSIDTRDPDISGGMGLLAFITTSFLVALFIFRLIWRNRKNYAKILPANSFIQRRHRGITTIIISIPLAAAIAAAAGDLATATEVMSKIFFSGQLVVGAYVVYGVVRRSVQLAQRKVSLKQAIERREKAIQLRKDKQDAEDRGDVETVTPPQINYDEIDVEMMSRQTSQLLFIIVTLGFVALMWLVWRELLPALGVFDRIEIGNYTLWGLFQSVFILIFSIIAAKNLPSFLEIFILNRTQLEAGTRYAIKTVLGYAIIVIGILIAFDRLGTQWAQLQWIVAALGVGIGFGLQEIIANFISGLIILFERPVRVGDYITIGDQSGTVSRIQIRATTLSDLDNREILIPNKELITGRVTNWTLSNSTTRLIITVGIAYGSDTDQARDLMLAVLKDNPKVLDTPAPSVLLTNFGDSSLDFQLRFFLRNFEDRWPVTHVIYTDVNKALEAAGITIPFPQRDLNIISQTK